MRGNNELDRGQYDRAGMVEYATGCALLIRRETFEVAGPLDESYFMYQEDYAFCDQVRRGNLLLWYEPEAVVYHVVSASAGEGSPRKWRYWSQGTVLFYLQHYRRRWQAMASLVVFLIWVVVRDLAKGKRGWLIPLFQGLSQGWNDIPD
jgi:GT2 family glycosyltransferase